MESYGKLKKRTFKLTYISEAEKAKGDKETQKVKPDDGKSTQEDVDAASQKEAEAQAQEVATAGVGQLYDDSKRVEGGEPWAFLSPKKGNLPERVSLILGAGWPMALADKGGIPDVSSKGWKELVNYFLNSEGTKNAAKDARIAAEKLRRETLGVLLDEANEDPENPKFLNPKEIQAIEEESVTKITELCKLGVLKGNICKSKLLMKQYIGGSREMSLESKLVNGIGFTGFNDDGKMIKADLPEEDIKKAFKTNLELLKQMEIYPQTPEEKEQQCSYIKDRIGTVGSNRVVLFTNADGDGDPKNGSPTGGAVLKNNALQTSMLKRFIDCGIQKYSFPGTTNALNEVKGRFNEGFMGLMTRMFAEVARWKVMSVSQTDRKAQLTTLISDFKTDMQNTLDDLQKFAEGTSMNVAMDIDSYPVMKEIEGQIKTLTTKGEIPKVMAQLYVQMGGLLRDLKADDIIPGGTAQSLGGKVDNFFLYAGPNSQKRAQQAAPYLDLNSTDVVSRTPKDLYDNAPKAMKKAIKKAIENQGLKITNNEDEVHLLSAGNKLSVGPDVKFGDLSLDRAMIIVMGKPITGRSAPVDNDKWYDKLNQSLQFGPGDLGEQGSIASYAKDVHAMYDNCGLLATQSTYTNEDGKIVLTNTAQISQELQATVQSSFSYGEKGSNFYAAVMEKDKDGHMALIDLSDPDNQQRAAEALKRDYLTYRFKMDYNRTGPPPDDWEAKKKGAIDSMCRIAGSTIMEMSEMGQVVTQEGANKKAIVINQNAILRGLGAARKSGKLKIDISGSTTKFTFDVIKQDGTSVQVTYRTNMERHKDRPQVTGKISKEDAGNAGRTIDPLQTGITGAGLEDDTMYQYMVGQMRLLETLINQAKDSHPL